MKDPFILKILDLFAPIFTRQNINYSQMRLIMKLKLIQDRRKPSLYFKNIKPSKKKDSNMYFFSLLFFGLMGLLFLSFIAVISIKSLLLGSVLFYTILMVFISYAIIIEFSLDFFNISDQVILLSKPVGYRELNVAKILHIFLYMSGLVFAISLPTVVFWAVQFSVLVSIVTLVFIMFSLLFLLFCSALLYGFILSKFSGEKLKDTISMIQIVSIIIICLGIQLFMNTALQWFAKLEISGIPPLLYLFPSTWFALPSYMVGSSYISVTSLAVVLAALILTVLGFRYYFSDQAFYFEKNLYKMKIVDTKNYKRKEPLAMKFAWLMKSGLSKAFYKFSLIMLTRERRLKQVIYPFMAMCIIYPILFIYRYVIKSDINIVETDQFFLYYFSIFMIFPISIYTNFSDYYKASWIYYYLPLKSPACIIKGAKTAMMVGYQSILFIINSLIFLLLWKFTIIPQVISMLLNSLIIQFLYQHISKRVLPFSEELKTGNNTAFTHFSFYLCSFVFIPLATLIHYLIYKLIPGFILPFILIQLAALYLLITKHYKIMWSDL